MMTMQPKRIPLGEMWGHLARMTAKTLSVMEAAYVKGPGLSR
jgi:hypothetical protein